MLLIAASSRAYDARVPVNSDISFGASEQPIVFDYFELDDLPVVIDRQGDCGWMWSRGAWQNDVGLPAKCYSAGQALTQDAFVHKFPYAALALLDVEIEG